VASPCGIVRNRPTFVSVLTLLVHILVTWAKRSSRAQSHFGGLVDSVRNELGRGVPEAASMAGRRERPFRLGGPSELADDGLSITPYSKEEAGRFPSPRSGSCVADRASRGAGAPAAMAVPGYVSPAPLPVCNLEVTFCPRHRNLRRSHWIHGGTYYAEQRRSDALARLSR
jgi:hypothetical protein